MAKKIHDLKQNRMTFEARGLITGTKSKNFYRSGTTRAGNSFNEINFGLTIAPQKTIYMKISGFEQNEVFYFEKVKKGEKGETKRIPWKDRKKSPGENYRLSGINISVSKDEKGKNINEVLVSYDAVEHLHAALKDGDSFYIKGDIQPSSYVNKDGNVTKKVELVPTQMSYTNDPIDFEAEGFEPKADIMIEPFIFASIDKEMDENDKPTGRFVMQGYDVNYNSIELMSFIIEAQDASLANKIKKKMKPGNAMTMYGNINVVHDIVEVEDDDNDWGVQRKSKQNRVNSRSRFEYVLFDVKGATFDTETYSEDSIAQAMKAIKNAKDASAKFVDVSETSTDDWGSDEDLDDMPWD